MTNTTELIKYETTDYSLFNYNGEIDEKELKRWIKLFKQYGCANQHIVVNREGKIVDELVSDGRIMFEVFKALNLPVVFCFKDDLDRYREEQIKKLQKETDIIKYLQQKM